MSVEQYSLVENDWINLGAIINDLTQRVVGQELHPTSEPTFGGGTITGNLAIGGNLDLTGSLTLAGLTASRLVATNAGKALESSDLSAWVTGTTNQIAVTDDTDGTVTLSTPQDLHIEADVQFNSIDVEYFYGQTFNINSSPLDVTYGVPFKANTASIPITVNLPQLTSSSRIMLFSCIGGNALTLDPNGAELIDGESTLVLNNNENVIIADFGDQWRILSGTGLIDPVNVNRGGTGAATLTDGGILLGSGTGAVTALAQATNGQLPIGSTGVDPVLGGLTGTANQVTVTNGAGSITLSTPQDTHTEASPTFAGLTTTAGRIVGVTRLTGATTLNTNHHHVLCDTDGGAFTVTLPTGVAGTYYRIVNTGASANNLTITPDGSELLLGVNSSFILGDGEALIIVYESTEGWW